MRATLRRLMLAAVLCCGAARAGPSQMLMIGPEQSVSGQAIVTWVAPVLDIPAAAGEGGSAVADLAGYKVYKSTVSGIGPWTFVATVSNPATLTYTVTGLGYATWYFCVASYDTAGNIGNCSTAGTKTLP